MALTRLDRTGDGVTTTYAVSFDLGYLRQEYVYVYLEGNNYSDQLDYTWVNDSQIVLSEPVPSGQVFSIRRIIPRDRIINDYEDGAILREKNLDDSFLQAIMILQEIQDGYIQVDGDFVVDADLDMFGHAIKNCISVTGLLETLQNDGAVPYAQIVRMINERAITGTSVVPLGEPAQTGDGVTKTFNTPASVYSPELTFFITIDGVKQRATYDYTIDISGNVVFDEAPPQLSVIEVLWYQPVITQTSTGFGFTTTKSDANGIVVAFPLQPDASIEVDDQIVSIDGVIQEPTTDFTTSIGVLTFSEAPPLNSRVVIRSVKLQDT